MNVGPLDEELTDGEVVLRPPVAGDADVLVAGRDAEFMRFLGAGDPDPAPTAVVLNESRQIVGWIDCDVERPWLREGEVNIGYSIFPEHRGVGFATRSLVLFVEHLHHDAGFAAATLLVDPANAASIAVARRAGFARRADIDGQLCFHLPARHSR